MKIRIRHTLFVFSLLATTAIFNGSAFAGDTKPDFATTKALGNWAGLRTELFDKGLSVDMYYKADAWRNLSGGTAKGGRALDNLDVKFTVDGDKAFKMPGTTFFVYFLNNNGGRPNDLVGSNGGIDNIEVPARSFKLYEAWAQKEFYDGKISVLAGLHDLNSEFYVTDTSGLFLNPTYGIGTEASGTGDNGPSIFPYTSAAVRLAVHPTDSTYAQVAIFDGVPGDPNHPRGTHIEFKDKEGALAIAEGGIKSEALGHFAVGTWEYTAGRPDQLTPAIERKTAGVYFLADRSIYKDSDRTVNAFARLGFTNGKVNQFKDSWSLGFVFSGFIPSRKDGQIGLALSRSDNSSEYVAANAPIGKSETQAELTYRDMLMPWLSLQPDLQYTIDPGSNPALRNAWTLGMRLGIDF